MSCPHLFQFSFRDEARVGQEDAVDHLDSLSELPIPQQRRDLRFDSTQLISA